MGLHKRLSFFVCVSIMVLMFAGQNISAADYPENPAVTAAVREFVTKGEVAGVMTIVAAPDKIVHCGSVGMADIAGNVPVKPDTIFWIASMTKPITATAVLMLQDDGKLSVDDPVGKYIPELADMKTKDGKSYALTLRHLLTHTSGMCEATPEESKAAQKLADLIPIFAKRPLLFEPGSKWQYCQSGINSLGRIIEIVSGQSYPEFLQKRLGMLYRQVGNMQKDDPRPVDARDRNCVRYGEIAVFRKIGWTENGLYLGFWILLSWFYCDHRCAAETDYPLNRSPDQMGR